MRTPLALPIAVCCAVLPAGAARAVAQGQAPAESPAALGASVPAHADAPGDNAGLPALGGREARPGDAVTLLGGPGRARFAGAALGVPLLWSVALEWSHTVALYGGAAFEVGLRGSLLHAPYDRLHGLGPDTSFLAAGLGTARVVFAHGRWEASAGLGIGVASWSGLGPDNPFTRNGTAAEAPVAMPSVSCGAGVSYLLPRGWSVGLGPRYAVSATTSDLFAAGVRQIEQLELELGVGLRL